MPRVVSVREIDPPPEEEFERQVFPAPDGTVSLVFDHPSEYRMGVHDWEVRLEGRLDVDLTALIRSRGAFLGAAPPPQCYVPWSHDSRRVVLSAVGPNVAEEVIYDVESRDLAPVGTGGVAGAAWAPDRDVLLTLGWDRLELRRPPAPPDVVLRLQLPEEELPLAGWLSDGDHVFTVTRPHEEAVPRIEVFESTGGRSLGAVELAPSSVLSEAGSGRGRDVHLQHYADDDPRFLEQWESARLERGTGAILLASNRPAGPRYRYFGDVMRRLEERWVAVEIEL